MLRSRKAWAQLGAAGVIAAALATAALGADSAGPGAAVLAALPSAAGGSHAASVPSGASDATSAVSLPAAAGDVAGKVLAAITGGDNPSSVKGRSGDTPAAAAADRAREQRADDDEANDISPAERVGQAGTTGTRPGFGCGDRNHTHSGPPGRPNATPPPGCAGR